MSNDMSFSQSEFDYFMHVVARSRDPEARRGADELQKKMLAKLAKLDVGGAKMILIELLSIYAKKCSDKFRVLEKDAKEGKLNCTNEELFPKLDVLTDKESVIYQLMEHGFTHNEKINFAITFKGYSQEKAEQWALADLKLHCIVRDQDFGEVMNDLQSLGMLNLAEQDVEEISNAQIREVLDTHFELLRDLEEYGSDRHPDLRLFPPNAFDPDDEEPDDEFGYRAWSPDGP